MTEIQNNTKWEIKLSFWDKLHKFLVWPRHQKWALYLCEKYQHEVPFDFFIKYFKNDKILYNELLKHKSHFLNPILE